jgi:hypothetical protein
MARFRKRRSARSRFGRKSRHSRSSGRSNVMSVLLPAVIYGAGRQYLVNLAQPLTSKIPLGAYADEVVLGGAGYLLAKKGRGMLKNVGLAMLTIEAASLGSGLIGGGLGGSSSGGAF